MTDNVEKSLEMVKSEKTGAEKKKVLREGGASGAGAAATTGAATATGKPEAKKTPPSGTDPALAKLRAAAKGLLFMSESDKPIRAFVWDDVATPESAIDATVLTGAKKVPDGATVATRTLDDFFKNATVNQAWFGEEEKVQAERFRALVAVLKEQLAGVQVFRVEEAGEARVAVYIVGRTAAGNLAGVQTELIET